MLVFMIMEQGNITISHNLNYKLIMLSASKCFIYQILLSVFGCFLYGQLYFI